MIRYWLFFIIPILWISCGNTQHKNDKGVTFDSLSIDTTVYLDKKNQDPAYHIDINMIYAEGKNSEAINQTIINSMPFLQSDSTQTVVTTNFKDVLHNYIRQESQNYIRENKAGYLSDKSLAHIYQYSFDVKTKVEKTTDNIINYIASTYYYAGGAHGMGQTIALNIRLDNGKKLTLDDIFTDHYEAFVTKLIQKKIAKMFEVNSVQELEDVGVWVNNNFYVSPNFILSKDTITFIYCEDEIAAHAVGQIDVVIPKKELSSILKNID